MQKHDNRRLLGFIPAVALALASVCLSACTPWPEFANGGLAERYPTTWNSLRDLEYRHEALDRAGGMRFSAGRMIDAQLLMNRAQREFEGGLERDAVYTLMQAEAIVAHIERDSAKWRRLHGSRTGS